MEWCGYGGRGERGNWYAAATAATDTINRRWRKHVEKVLSFYIIGHYDYDYEYDYDVVRHLQYDAWAH